MIHFAFKLRVIPGICLQNEIYKLQMLFPIVVSNVHAGPSSFDPPPPKYLDPRDFMQYKENKYLFYVIFAMNVWVRLEMCHKRVI